MSSDSTATSSQPKRMEDYHPVNAQEEHLRKVEVDVVIPKIMKEEAKLKCVDAVTAFTQCCRGRTVSIWWACRDVNEKLDQCLRQHMTDADFDRAKAKFLKDRAANLERIAAKEAQTVPMKQYLA